MIIDDKYCPFCMGKLKIVEQTKNKIVLGCEFKKSCAYKYTLNLKEGVRGETTPLFKPQFSLKNQFKHIF